MTTEEFKKKILMPSETPPILDEKNKLEFENDIEISDIPNSYDWKDHGAVSNVKVF